MEPIGGDFGSALTSTCQVPAAERRKIALFCNVREEAVIQALDVPSIYEVPLAYHREGLDEQVLRAFNISGAPKPDLHTPAAFKKSMLDAQSIAYIPASAAGSYVTGVFERLGIAEQMKAKTKPQTATTQIPQAVAKGEAELGVFLVNVLIGPGVELAGSFPAELQQELVFTAAVAVDAKEADAAKAFIDFLTSPAATAVIKAMGMKPG